MENNIYYIPDKSDFVDGLEYKDIRTPYLGYTYNLRPGKELEFNYLRVKCLDIEDTESLGWIDSVEFYMLGDCQLYINDIDGTIEIYRREQIFKGKIKSKTELSKLMQQLNICKKD